VLPCQNKDCPIDFHKEDGILNCFFSDDTGMRVCKHYYNNRLPKLPKFGVGYKAKNMSDFSYYAIDRIDFYDKNNPNVHLDGSKFGLKEFWLLFEEVK